LPLGLGRKLSERIAAAESLQLIGAFSDPQWLVELAPRFDRYRELNGAFWGAYGLRIERQVSDMISKLRADSWTRQAVATLWDKRWDNLPEKRDYPCTVALGFTQNPSFTQNRLDMHVTMRSNDAWLGLPYDMFQFTQLQHTVCRALDVQVGTYTHTAWSMHLYEADLEASERVQSTPTKYNFDPTGIGEVGVMSSYKEIIYRARTLARDPAKVDWKLTPSEEWYRDAIHGSPA
jgi:thymidylate synthase